MIAKQEIRRYAERVRVWVGKYRNSHNLLHWHRDCELLYVEHGSIDVFCERKTHTLNTGEILYVDSGQMHYMQARDPKTVLIVIIFDYEILRPYMGNFRLASPKLTGVYPVPRIYGELRDLLLRKPPFYAGEAAGMILSLMASVYRNEPLEVRTPSDRTAERFRSLLEDVSEHCESYTFTGAASYMNMSDAYFSRYFKGSAGVPFSHFLNYVRTSRAVALLREGDLSITEVAERCGFGTIRSFNRIFKEFTGYTPSRLPADFVLGEDFVFPSDAPFNPTLHDCELIESVANLSSSSPADGGDPSSAR